MLSSKHLDPCDLTQTQKSLDCISFVDGVLIIKNCLLIGIPRERAVFWEEKRPNTIEASHTAFETKFTFIKKRLTEKAEFFFRTHFKKSFLTQFGFADIIQNKIPPMQDSRSGLHKRYEPISIEEVNAHPLVLFNFMRLGAQSFVKGCKR